MMRMRIRMIKMIRMMMRTMTIIDGGLMEDDDDD